MFQFRIGLAILALVFAGLSHAWADELFQPYLRGEAPVVLREVPAPDLDLAAGPDVQVRRLVFASHVVEGETNGVYAIIARPSVPGPFPGILLFHGGTGIANETEAVRWARRGYVALAVDIPGVADPLRAVHSTGTWRYRPYGAFFWTTFPTAEKSVVHQAVVAGLQGFDLLRSQPTVDPMRLGVMGWSWGGYLSTMVCGLMGDRVKAGFSMYGSGFYEWTWFRNYLDWIPPAQRSVWLESLDAGRRAPGITAPFFIAAPANDTFFHPPAVERTLAAIPADAAHLFAPNSDHRLAVPGGTGTESGDSLAKHWFDWYLRGNGGAFPTIEWQASPDPEVVAFRVQGSRPILTVSVWHSRPCYPENWPQRVWVEIPVRSRGGGRFEAILPPGARTTGAAWFALASDDRPVTVSTWMAFAGAGVAAAYYFREDFDRIAPDAPVPGWLGAVTGSIVPLSPAADAVARIQLQDGLAQGSVNIGSRPSATNGLRLKFQFFPGEAGPDWQVTWLLRGGDAGVVESVAVGYGFVLSSTHVSLLRLGGPGGMGSPEPIGPSEALPESARVRGNDWNAVEFRWETGGRLQCLLNGAVVAAFEEAENTGLPTFQTLEWSGSGAPAGRMFLDDLEVAPAAPPPPPPSTFRLLTVGNPRYVEAIHATEVHYGFEGIPGRRYRLASTRDLASGEWSSLGDSIAGPDGRFDVVFSESGDATVTGSQAVFFRAETMNSSP